MLETISVRLNNSFILFVVILRWQYSVVLVAFTCMFGVCLCGAFLPAFAPVPRVLAGPAIAAVHPEPYDPAPQYAFAYNVQDQLTGDHKYVSIRLCDSVGFSIKIFIWVIHV